MAYFKRSHAKRANFVKEGTRFRRVGEGYGDHILVPTARDIKVRAERDARLSCLPIPHIVAIHNHPNTLFERKSVWTRRDIQHFWWYHDYDELKMQQAIAHMLQTYVQAGRARNMATLLLYHRRVTPQQAWNRDEKERRPVVIQGSTFYPEASPSYLEYDRLMLDYQQVKLRNMEMALRIFQKRSLLWTFQGKDYRAPYTK